MSQVNVSHQNNKRLIVNTPIKRDNIKQTLSSLCGPTELKWALGKYKYIMAALAIAP